MTSKFYNQGTEVERVNFKIKKSIMRTWAAALVFVLAICMVGPVSMAAKSGIRLNKRKVSVKVNQTKSVRVMGVKKKKIKDIEVESKDESIATAKKKNKNSVSVTGKKKGKAKIVVTVHLKKKIKKKKKYDLKFTANVTPAKTPATPTPASSMTPTPAPTPVVSGASISLEKPEYKCTVNGENVEVIADLLPATANEPVKWEIANSEIATIEETKPTLNGHALAYICGANVGTTMITAKIGAGATSAKIVVEDQIIAAGLDAVKQTKANELVATLDMDYKDDNQGLGKDKFDIDVYNDKGIVVKTIPVNKIKYQEVTLKGDDGVAVTGTSATLTLDSPFSDKDKVTVNLYKGKDFATSKDFVASVGAPAAINVATTEAQRDVETPIEVVLTDANGIDVTSTVDIDSRVTMEVTGDEASWNTSPISSANIKMTKIGATAMVNVAYTKPDSTSGKPDYQSSGLITCIAPKPVVGNPHFMYFSDPKSWDDSEDKVAKFYEYPDRETAEVEVGGEGKYSFYASSTDDNEAISYDEYTVMSSNGDVASASVDGAGKFCNITVNGVKAGKCNINVMAKKNTVTTNYIIPVEVIKINDLSVFKIVPSRKTVSNCYDASYQAGNYFEVTAEDSLGNDLASSTVSSDLEINYELISPKEPEPFSFKHSDGGTIILKDKFTVGQPGEDSVEGTFNAQGAKAGSYTVKATAYFNGITKTSTCTVNVRALPKEVYELDAANPPKAEYSIESDSKELFLSGAMGVRGTAHVRLKATIGGVFAGYVYMGQYDGNTYPQDLGVICHYVGNQSWRTNFVSGEYISYIGDQLKFASGQYGVFTTSDDSPIVLAPDHHNAVAEYYQVKGSSVIFDLRGAAQSGVKWQTKQTGFPNEHPGGDLGAGENPLDDNMVCLNDKANNFATSSFSSGAAITSDLGDRGLVLKVYDEANEGKAQAYYPDKKRDPIFALPGTYGATLRWKQSKDGVNLDKKNLVQKSASVTIKVTDDIFVPKIDVSKRSLYDFSDTGVMEVLRPSCDLNCNVSRYASVKGLFDKDFKPVEFTNNSVTVNYVLLSEDKYDMYVPLGAAFTKKG